MINYGKFNSQHSPLSEKKSFLIELGLPLMIMGVNLGLVVPIRVNRVYRNKF